MVSFIDVCSSNWKPVLEDYRKLAVVPIKLKFSTSGVDCVAKDSVMLQWIHGSRRVEVMMAKTFIGSFYLMFVSKQNLKNKTPLLCDRALPNKWCISGNTEVLTGKAHSSEFCHRASKRLCERLYAHCFRSS
jgi:hypothetical protein